ncbi:hypothetical protein ACIG5E_09950 [Kitasatospora sp. NPDC053057]|uniref:hypothetical protein n=1 Tax=Kitasatospora sp. NPDC053057 TaxID=3364062 RepID=UPI0037CC88D2
MTQTRPMRGAGGLAIGWGVVLLGWAAYNCFGQVGFATYLKGVFYYGGTSVDAETGSLNYGLLYLIAGILLLRGRNWALGVAAGVALVEGYNRVRSLTGALLDKPQREWFTGTTEGGLKLATFALGVVVTAALILLLARSKWREQPEGAAAGEPHWSIMQTVPAAPTPVPYAQQQPQPVQPQPQPQAAWPQQPPAQPGWQQQPVAPQPQPSAWPPAQPQPPQPLPYAQQPTQTATSYQPAPAPAPAPQPWPPAPPAPGQPAPGPVVPPPAAPGPVVPPPAAAPPADRPPQA